MARNPHAQSRHMAVKVEEFAPEIIVRFLTERAQAGLPVAPPCHQTFMSVVVFADICGFTALSERFAEKGGLGSEDLGFFLNRYFELLVKTVSKHGGDVVKFAGDAMVILWPEEAAAGGGVDLRSMALRAVMCCVAVQMELGRATLSEDVEFNIKLGVGAGPVNLVHIGGVFGRLEYLVTGPALQQAFGCESECGPGGVVVSPEVWDLVGPALDGRRLKNSRNVAVSEVVSKIRTRRLQRTEPSPYLSDVPKMLRSYVPAAILPHLKYSSRKWASELRTLTVLFVNLGFTAAELVTIDKTTLHKLNDVLQAVQKVIYQYEGSLNKFLIDDKGSTLLAVLGLPPLAHADDPERAVLAAQQIATDLLRLGMRPYIGVTSGIALCGPMGSGSRREYSVLGDVVNTSARLMQKAAALELTHSEEFLGCILCDEATKASAESNSSVVFEDIGEVELKGKKVMVNLFQPGLLKRPSGHVPVLWDNKTPPVVPGFHGLDVDLVEKVQGMIFSRDAPNPVLLGGETGCGKTTLVKHFVRKAADLFGAVLAVPMPDFGFADHHLQAIMGNVSSLFSGSSWMTAAEALVAAAAAQSAAASPSSTSLQARLGLSTGVAAPGGAAAAQPATAAGTGGAGTGETPALASATHPVVPLDEVRRDSGGGSGGSSSAVLALRRGGSGGRALVNASGMSLDQQVDSASPVPGPAPGPTVIARRSPSPLARDDSRSSLLSTWTLGERRGSSTRNISLPINRRMSVESTLMFAPTPYSPGRATGGKAIRRFSAVSRASVSSFGRARSFLGREHLSQMAMREMDYSMIKARPRKRRSFMRRRFQRAGSDVADELQSAPPPPMLGGELWRRHGSHRSVRSTQSGDTPTGDVPPMYSSRIVYAVAQTFKETVRCFLWRQVVHQLTVDFANCFAPEDRAEVLELAKAVRRGNLFAKNAPPTAAAEENRVLLELVRLHARHVPVVIVLDELQWAGDRDWEIIEALADMLDRNPGVACFLLAVTQPMHMIKYQPNFRPVAPSYFRFLGMLSTEYWEMEPLHRGDLDMLTAQELNLESVPRRLSRIVNAMSGGNPRFAKKFVHALVKVGIVSLSPSARAGTPSRSPTHAGLLLSGARGSLASTPGVSLSSTPGVSRNASGEQDAEEGAENGEAEGAPQSPSAANIRFERGDTLGGLSSVPPRLNVVTLHVSHLDVLPLPYTVQRIIATFIDRLSNSQNLVLKMACVLCLGGGITNTAFDFDLLRGIFPASRERRSSQQMGGGAAELASALLSDVYAMVQFGLLQTAPYSSTPGMAEGKDPRGHSRRFRFTAGVIRDVVYHRMLHKQRRLQHKHAAEHLQRVGGSAEWKARLPERELNKHVLRHLKLAEEAEAAHAFYDKHFRAQAQAVARQRRHTALALRGTSGDEIIAPPFPVPSAPALSPKRKQSSLFLSMVRNALRRGSGTRTPVRPANPRPGRHGSWSSSQVESMRLMASLNKPGHASRRSLVFSSHSPGTPGRVGRRIVPIEDLGMGGAQSTRSLFTPTRGGSPRIGGYGSPSGSVASTQRRRRSVNSTVSNATATGPRGSDVAGVNGDDGAWAAPSSGRRGSAGSAAGLGTKASTNNATTTPLHPRFTRRRSSSQSSLGIHSDHEADQAAQKLKAHHSRGMLSRLMAVLSCSSERSTVDVEKHQVTVSKRVQQRERGRRLSQAPVVHLRGTSTRVTVPAEARRAVSGSSRASSPRAEPNRAPSTAGRSSGVYTRPRAVTQTSIVAGATSSIARASRAASDPVAIGQASSGRSLRVSSAESIASGTSRRTPANRGSDASPRQSGGSGRTLTESDRVAVPEGALGSGVVILPSSGRAAALAQGALARTGSMSPGSPASGLPRAITPARGAVLSASTTVETSSQADSYQSDMDTDGGKEAVPGGDTRSPSPDVGGGDSAAASAHDSRRQLIKRLPPLQNIMTSASVVAAECITPGRRGIRVHSEAAHADVESMSDHAKHFVRSGTWRVMPRPARPSPLVPATDKLRRPPVALATITSGAGTGAGAGSQQQLGIRSGSPVVGPGAPSMSSPALTPAQPQRRRSVQLRGGIRGSTTSLGAAGMIGAVMSKDATISDADDGASDDGASRRASVATVGTAEDEEAHGDTATPLPVPSFAMDRRSSRGGDALAGVRQLRRLSFTRKRRRFSDSAALGMAMARNPHIRRRRDSFYGLADGSEDQLRVGRIMLDLDRWNFNVMALDHVSDGTPLLHVATEVFERRGLYTSLGLSKDLLQQFVSEIEMGYLDQPFHNSVHAADVLQTTHVLLVTYEQYHKVQPEQVFALLVAAMIHDFKHPGVNNQFVRTTRHALTEVYKGDDVLEQFHVAEAFGLMQRRECDIFSCLGETKQREVKDLVRRLVLATSLSRHFEFCQHVEHLLRIDDLDYSDPRMEEVFLKLLLKTADVSYACKPFAIHKLWVDRFAAECFAQGDRERERGFVPSVYHDRFRVTAAQSQLALATFIAEPLFSKFARVAPNARDLYQAPLRANMRFWQQEDWCRRNGTSVAGVVPSHEAAAVHGIVVDANGFGLRMLSPTRATSKASPQHAPLPGAAPGAGRSPSSSPTAVTSPSKASATGSPHEEVQFRLKPRRANAKGWFAATSEQTEEDKDEPELSDFPGANDSLYVSVRLPRPDAGSEAGHTLVSLVPSEVMTLHEEEEEEDEDGEASESKLQQTYSMKNVLRRSVDSYAEDDPEGGGTSSLRRGGTRSPLSRVAKAQAASPSSGGSSKLKKLRGATAAVSAAMYLRVSICRKLRYSFETSFL